MLCNIHCINTYTGQEENAIFLFLLPFFLFLFFLNILVSVPLDHQGQLAKVPADLRPAGSWAGYGLPLVCGCEAGWMHLRSWPMMEKRTLSSQATALVHIPAVSMPVTHSLRWVIKVHIGQQPFIVGTPGQRSCRLISPWTCHTCELDRLAQHTQSH